LDKLATKYGKIFQLHLNNVATLTTLQKQQQLISVWAEFKQSVIDKAINQWRPRLRAYVRASGQHFGRLIN